MVWLASGTYSATARIKPSSDTTAVFEQRSVASARSATAAQFEIIQSNRVLRSVVERLNLTQRWSTNGTALSEDAAIDQLRKSLTFTRTRDSEIIGVEAITRDAELSAAIANGVVESLQEVLAQEERKANDALLDQLRTELAAQSDRLNQAQQRVEILRKQFNLPADVAPMTDAAVRQLEDQLTRARIEAVGHRVRLKLLETPLIGGATGAIIAGEDAAVTELSRRFSDLEVRLATLERSAGARHPRLIHLRAERDAVAEQLQDRIAALTATIRTKYDLAEARLQELRSEYDEARQAAVSIQLAAFAPLQNAIREQELESRMYEALKSRVQQRSVEAAVPRELVQVIEQAETPARASQLSHLHFAVAAVLGLILAGLLVYMFELTDMSVRRAADVEVGLQSRILGTIRREPPAEANTNVAEDYFKLADAIDFGFAESGNKTIALVSTARGEGKTRTIAELARAYAAAGARVLVIDANLTRPAIHEHFNLSNDFGLGELLQGGMSPTEVMQRTSVPGLAVITAGQTRRAGDSARVREVLARVSGAYDVVLVDTAPILEASLTLHVARACDATVMLVRYRSYALHEIRRARQMLAHAGATVIGMAINALGAREFNAFYCSMDPREPWHSIRLAQRPSEFAIVTTSGRAAA